MSPAASFARAPSAAQLSSDTFKALKAICVPLFSNSLLSPQSIPRASTLLSQLSSFLDSIPDLESTLTPSTIEYVFFPISNVLQRNAVSSIPDVIMEKVMSIIATLLQQWWWSCSPDVWEQLLLLSAAILGGIDYGAQDPKGKQKSRDEETKHAAAQCLWAVLSRRDETCLEPTATNRASYIAEARFIQFQTRAKATKLLPILGQTLTSLLDTSQSAHRGLQTVSLRLVHALIVDYLPQAFIPSILPGVVSAMAKVALGRRETKGWSNGDTVDHALAVMHTTIVTAMGDEICEAEGALRTVTTLEDLGLIFEADGKPRSVPATPPPPSSLFTQRTSVWLAASASQLHMVLNTLSSLLSHPNPIALLSLSQLSHALLSNTSQTLPDSQPLLLSFLLSLSSCHFPNVADTSRNHLLTLLQPPFAPRFTLLEILSRSTRDNLTFLPRLLPSHSDAKVERLARQVSAACQLSTSVHAISDGVGTLLGPTGGIEKWGWSLLSILELTVPPLFVSTVQAPQALLEGSTPEGETMYPFPPVNMRHVSSESTREALDGMFRALGSAAGVDCLFAVEWFLGVARKGRTTREVAALWCAGRIFEGVGGVSLERLDGPERRRAVPKRVEKTAKWIAKVVAEFWEQQDDDERGGGEPVVNQDTSMNAVNNDGRLPLEYVKGLDPIVTRFDLNRGDTPTRSTSLSQPILHKVLSLQLLSIASAVLQSQFTRLLLHTLYPILQSLVSEASYVSSTALATLHYVTFSTAYASPSNLLLANFDYALDGVSRRLDRRQLDPEAPKILVVLVRLVGKDIVVRAADVVEACFDRLDEFHGYAALVEGLIEVLAEVVKVVEADYDAGSGALLDRENSGAVMKEDCVESFVEWYKHRRDPVEEERQENYGRAPREAWGNRAGKGKEKEVVNEQSSATPQDEDDPPLTPTQVLTRQIVAHSIYFLTHPSPLIRARILGLLDTACPTLSASTLLPSIHNAWPYILNRLRDPESYVVSAAASLVASLAEHVGNFMATRIWNDVWPRFSSTLSRLEEADSHSALARRGGHGAVGVGTESAFSQSHRLYKSILRTMRAVVKGTLLRSDVMWDILVAFRRFLHVGAHQELQEYAREVYAVLMVENGDAVWLVLSATMGTLDDPSDMQCVMFLREKKWDIKANARLILGEKG